MTSGIADSGLLAASFKNRAAHWNRAIAFMRGKFVEPKIPGKSHAE